MTMQIIDEKAIFNNDIARGVPMSNNDDYFVTNENIQRGEMPAFIWTDPQILDEKAKAKYLEMPTGDRPRFIIELLEQFYRNNPEYSNFVRVEIYKHPLRLLEFFQGIKLSHLKKIGIKEPERIRDDLRQSIEAAERSIAEAPIDIDDLTTFWPILKIRDLFTESQLAALYYIQNPKGEKADAADQDEASRITAKRADFVEYPLDKVNHHVWDLLEKDTRGQIRFNMLPKADFKLLATYAINFDALGDGVTITKRLTPSDKRVYIATSALFNAGNDLISATQIYCAMGNTGKPSPAQIRKINDSITKMTSARITLDNKPEADKLDGYTHFRYDGALLPIERVTAITNGKVTEAAIKMFREPPLMTFAKKRHQVTTISAKLLQSPISKTDANLLIDDYLIERISREKKKENGGCTILIKTLYEHANIKSKMQKQRAPEKIKKYLEYYKKAEFIKAYEMTNEKLVIVF